MSVVAGIFTFVAIVAVYMVIYATVAYRMSPDRYEEWRPGFLVISLGVGILAAFVSMMVESLIG